MVLVTPAACRERVDEGIEKLPPFSPVLNRLIATLASEDVVFGEIGALIEKDPVLAGNVLRVVNSALYGRRGTVSSVRHAVSLLGLSKLRNTVMTLSMSRIWNEMSTPGDWPSARFNQHGAASAVMADLLAQKTQSDFPEGAFVAGLLHDIGFLLLAITDGELFDGIRERHLESGQPLEDCERELAELDHAEFSAAALQRWRLPEPIVEAVRYQFARQSQSGTVVPLSSLLHAAEQLLRLRGLTTFDLEDPPAATPETILEPLGVAESWDDLLSQFEREFEPMRAFF